LQECEFYLEIGSKIRIKENSHIKKRDNKWVVLITVCTFFISVTLAFISDSIMPNAKIAAAILILFIIMVTGIVFDMIGLAIATASEQPFHSMASRRVSGAKSAIFLIRNAEKATSLCNDVIGDIAGIVSGSATAAIVGRLVYLYNYDSILLSLLLTGFVAAFTVGGKAVGKTYAISHANKITFFVALVIYYFEKIRPRRRA
jgi:CBS domain containing-hemolysin-like protein